MLTVADVLELPVLRAADPVVLAWEGGVQGVVRWVHPTELADIAPLLRGGDLVLTTGVALPGDDAAVTAYVGSLVESGAAGLVVELGRRWRVLPDHLVAECERLGLLLVALRREVRFAAVSQAVGERLVDRQLAELREAQRVHDTFTELSVAEAGPDDVLTAAQRLAGATVVLESEEHQVLDYRAGPGDPTAFLADWERRSRSVVVADRTTWDRSNGWLVTRLGRRERAWGRLVVESPDEPPQRLTALVERAAAALALHRLHDRTRDGHLRRLHHELLVQLLADASGPATAQRLELAGVPVERRRLVGLVLRGPGGAGASPDEVVAATLRAAELLHTPLLVAAFGSDVRVLLPVPARQDPDRTADRLVARVRSRAPVATAAAGSVVDGLAAAGRTLREAAHVLASLPPENGARSDARSDAGSDAGVLHRLADVHVRGLLALLADDERLRSFVDRELQPLRGPDGTGGSAARTDLREAARVVVEEWGNKSAAAARLRLSRPALYDRIARVERALGVDLADAEVRTSLHLALLADDLRNSSSQPAVD
ncbi:PucR family transcriptional regulator [Nocardioides aurantiacus]|uniref:Purine catabolism regulator n=1 Tax=Nocardioides aurantiacus TaxID=86796 RepID=A0A3N2CPC8_9ACTN|nr:PucR family transcriptional regulator ligand-binding domain-containing protein [Nocardioides aurantiacus]ROR89387.1 purine catabolism regulator [Nocardioides aurantiacus]